MRTNKYTSYLHFNFDLESGNFALSLSRWIMDYRTDRVSEICDQHVQNVYIWWVCVCVCRKCSSEITHYSIAHFLLFYSVLALSPSLSCFTALWLSSCIFYSYCKSTLHSITALVWQKLYIIKLCYKTTVPCKTQQETKRTISFIRFFPFKKDSFFGWTICSSVFLVDWNKKNWALTCAIFMGNLVVVFAPSSAFWCVLNIVASFGNVLISSNFCIFTIKHGRPR